MHSDYMMNTIRSALPDPNICCSELHQPVGTASFLHVQVEKLKAEAASQEAEVARLHSTTVQQLYLQDLDAFLEAYQAWEAEETANSGS